jgi:NAD(P)-dependent dehydrogenase (short-subunit alcohol dehydrogenase family)
LSGIGLAVAEQATSQGANVVVVSSNSERVKKAIQTVGGDAKGQTAVSYTYLKEMYV